MTTPEPIHGRIAFASYVDPGYLRGFEVLLTSLVLHNPWIDHDYVVLHSDLSTDDIHRIASLYPKIRFVEVDTERFARYKKGDGSNYLVEKAYYILDAFALEGYDRVVTLDVDMVVLGDVSELLDPEVSFGAVPQHFDSDQGRRMNSGVMTFDSTYLTPEFNAKLDAIGVAGAYQLDKHDQGVLAEALDGAYTQLPKRLNFVKRALPRGSEAPEDTRILHFTGRFKPWNGGDRGYAKMERLWHDNALARVDLWQRHVRASAAGSEVAAQMRAWLAPFSAVTADDCLDLRAAANDAREAGDFEREYQCRAAMVLDGKDGKKDLKALGSAAVATSRYDIARVALARAAAADPQAPEPWAQIADLEWKVRSYDDAQKAATEALRREPTYRMAHLVAGRVKWSRAHDRVVPEGAGPRVGHVAFYVDRHGNFGDVVLPFAVRSSIEQEVPSARWSSIHVHQVFDVEDAQWANDNLDMIVIGGGGLFLPDTAPNGNSGWQWNVTDAALRELTIPIVIYTVGYNLFRGQKFHSERFVQSLRLLVSKAAFVGLRNHGSVSAVKSLVVADEADKVEWLPCVTTVLHRDRADRPALADRRARVLLNVAYDRADRRFGDSYADFVEHIATFVRGTHHRADVLCLAHRSADEQILHDLRRWHGVHIENLPVYDMPMETALAHLADADVVVGMRGHAGMIPFGLATPFVSIISHDKLRYFLEDIGHEEWGVEIGDPHLGERLVEMVEVVLDEPDVRARELEAARVALTAVVNSANTTIAGLLPVDAHLVAVAP